MSNEWNINGVWYHCQCDCLCSSFCRHVTSPLWDESTDDQFISSLQWCHNGCNGIPNHQPHYCLLNGLDKKNHQSSASLAFVRGNHWWTVNSLHKWPVTRKMFPFDDLIMDVIIDTICQGVILYGKVTYNITYILACFISTSQIVA